MIPDLQPFATRCREDGEQVDVLVAEEAPRARTVLLLAHRRVVIQAQPKIGLGQLVIEDVGVGTEPLQHRLSDRFEKLLVRQD